jgi:hypothetical protein
LRVSGRNTTASLQCLSPLFCAPTRSRRKRPPSRIFGSPSDCPLPLSRRSSITVLASAFRARNQTSCLLLRSRFHLLVFRDFFPPQKCSLGFGRAGVHAIACSFSQTGRTDCFGSTSRGWMVASKCPLPDKLCSPPNFSGCLMSDDPIDRVTSRYLVHKIWLVMFLLLLGIEKREREKKSKTLLRDRTTAAHIDNFWYLLCRRVFVG